MVEKKNSSASLGEFHSTVDQKLSELTEQDIIPRIWNKDHTVWKEDPTEITNRLGWLHTPEVMADAVSDISAFVEELRKEGFTAALLLGMGGSSLAPEVFRNIFGVKDGYLDLAVLDSTDPGAVSAYAESLDPNKTLYIVSTKSGGTVETMSFMKYFYNQVQKAVGKNRVGQHFIAITDPGSGLESTARELQFRKIFLNDPDIGGRYSALSYFGLVPAALVGSDITRLLESGRDMAQQCREPRADDNPGAYLGAIMGELAQAGRDKLTLISSQQLSPFGAWVEQLIAESTGKEGKGILPVDGEEVLSPEYYGNDRLFVYLKLGNEPAFESKVRALEDAGHSVIRITLTDLYDLGAEFFRWEMATAVAGAISQINPFDQPNVESAKVLARQMVDSYKKEGKLPEREPASKDDGIEVYGKVQADTVGEALDQFLESANFDDRRRSYVAIQAYLQPTEEIATSLQQIRAAIQKKYKLATTVGFGPRFLHSTGQLHKGDAGHGLFIQLTADSEKDAPIPDAAGSDQSSITFGILKMAQALGDQQALLEAGRKVIRFHLGAKVRQGLGKVLGSV